MSSSPNQPPERCPLGNAQSHLWEPSGNRQRSLNGHRTQAARAFAGVGFALLATASVAQTSPESASGLASINPTIASPWFFGFGVLALFLLNSAFAASETSLELLKPSHVRRVKDREEPATAARLQKLLDRRDPSVAAATFGLQGCRFLLVLLSLSWTLGVLSPGTTIGESGNLVLITGGVSVGLLLVSLIIELIPRSYASQHPDQVALFLSKFIRFNRVIFAIPTRVVTSLANLLTSRFGGRARFALAEQAEEEIRTLVDTATESGAIESEEKELLHSVFEFSDTIVREVMTPRVDLDAMPITSDPKDVVTLIESSGHSRIPLYESTDDAIVGVVHAKDLLMAMLSSKPVYLRKLMRPALFIPENKSLNDLLREMRQLRTQMAVVQDEFGGTAGIVTIEDIVEELVGDIVDEYDQEEPEIVRLEDGFAVDGKTHVDDVNHEIGSAFESEEFDTIGGYVFGLFGRQPSAQDSIEEDEYRFTIIETDGRRIVKVKIEPTSKGELEVSEEGERA